MNEVDYVHRQFGVGDGAACTPRSPNGVRASWVVRPDGTATGVQFAGFPEDDRDFDPFNLDGLTDFQVRNNVRNKRNLGPAGPIEFPQGGKPQDRASTANRSHRRWSPVHSGWAEGRSEAALRHAESNPSAGGVRPSEGRVLVR